MSRTLFLSGCLLLASTAGADIYKSQDAEGRIIYSDRPAAGAEVLELPATNTTPATAVTERKAKQSAPEKGFTGYQLRITQPANDSIIANGLAPQAVILDIQPALREGHQIRLTLDGIELAIEASTHFSLPGLPRGSHRLQAEALGADGEALGRSTPHRMFVYLPGSR